MVEPLPFSHITTFKFEIRPIALPADLRPLRKIAQIILVLKNASKSEKCSFLKLQLFNWAFASAAAMDQLKKYILYKDSEYQPSTIPLDPSINRALEFAIAEGLVELDKKGKLTLTGKGQRLAELLLSDESVLHEEKVHITQLGVKVNETKVLEIAKGK